MSEIQELRQLLRYHQEQKTWQTRANRSTTSSYSDADIVEPAVVPSLNKTDSGIQPTATMDSQYDEFPETTHAWAIFADDPKQKTATRFDRLVGCIIIAFQLFTYSLFVKESISDYHSGQVPLTISHADCLAADLRPGYNGERQQNGNNNNADDVFAQSSGFQCEAGFTDNWDAIVAFFMLGIFLTADFIQAARAIKNAPTASGLAFAILAGFEVAWAFVAASVAVSYNLYIGEVTDAVEVGIGLLFVRELSARAYHGIRQKRNRTQNALSCCSSSSHIKPNSKIQQYKTFFATLTVLVVIGFIMDPLCQYLFAAPLEY